MTVLTPRFVGRPVLAAPEGSTVARDKWALVDRLTLAAEDFGLSHRNIAVLRAMLTFVPERDLPARMGVSIVFASNQTLSTRLGGMPESTLRRHLAALVKAGVIARFDSPNRKRYAKRLGHGIACAFGFDLGPLSSLAPEIEAHASARELRQQEHDLLRTQILRARQTLCEALLARDIDPDGIHDQSPLLARARLLLRRKNNNEELEDLLKDFDAVSLSSIPGASDSENERHQHKEKNKNSDVEVASTSNASGLNLLSQFTEYQKMFPSAAHDLHDISRHAASLVPMMGIDQPVYEEAKQALGADMAPIAVLCILERFDKIENPGGYLRHLTKQARAGDFNLRRLLSSIGRIVS